MIEEVRIVPESEGGYEFRVYYSAMEEAPSRRQVLDAVRTHLQNIDIALADGDTEKATLVRTPKRMHLLVERPVGQGGKGACLG